MKKLFIYFTLTLLVTSCASSPKTEPVKSEESIKSTVYYDQIEMIWQLLNDPNKITICEFVDGVNDDGAIAAFAIALKFDLEIDYDSNKDKFDEAIKLFVKEKC